jgi:4-diphosphocytidyl-2-C-methyl-D-erythritol kinase
MTADPARRLTPIVRLAPAKLNLTLAVVGRRPDGYHALHSVMVPLALSDVLSLAPSPGPGDTLHVAGFDAGPVAENLFLRALGETRHAVGAGWAGPAGPPPALAARLEKRIPVAAGLAGGSSDAAAAIDGALAAWGADLGPEERHGLAVRLGSDVPFFLAGGTALVEGRGERVTPLHGVRGDPPGVLLVTPDATKSTAAVFAAWAAGAMAEPGTARRASEHFASEFGSGLTTRALMERAGVLASANELFPAAASVVPALVPLRRALMRLLARPVGLSGAGPTLWTLYPSLEAAQAAAAAVLEALTDGRLVASDGRTPFVAATTITVQAPIEESAKP